MLSYLACIIVACDQQRYQNQPGLLMKRVTGIGGIFFKTKNPEKISLGCSIAPISLSAPVSPVISDPHSCGVQELSQLGYTVEEGGGVTGFVRGVKRTVSYIRAGRGGGRLRGSAAYEHIMTVSILDDPSLGPTIRVTVEVVWQDDGSAASHSVRPLQEDKEDAEAILDRCGTTG